MFLLEKKIQISAAHHLPEYNGPCAQLHGHNWHLTIHCGCKDGELNDQGMVIDFTEIKRIVNVLDHDDLNKHIENPTAENIAEWLCEQIPHCIIVEVEETSGNKVIYQHDARIRALHAD